MSDDPHAAREFSSPDLLKVRREIVRVLRDTPPDQSVQLQLFGKLAELIANDLDLAIQLYPEGIRQPLQVGRVS